MAAALQASFHHTTASKTVVTKKESRKKQLFFFHIFLLIRKENIFPRSPQQSYFRSSLAKTRSPETIKQERRSGINLPSSPVQHLARFPWPGLLKERALSTTPFSSSPDRTRPANVPECEGWAFMGPHHSPAALALTPGLKGPRPLPPCCICRLCHDSKGFSHYGPWKKNLKATFPLHLLPPKPGAVETHTEKGSRLPIGNKWWETQTALALPPHT